MYSYYPLTILIRITDKIKYIISIIIIIVLNYLFIF